MQGKVNIFGNVMQIKNTQVFFFDKVMYGKVTNEKGYTWEGYT